MTEKKTAIKAELVIGGNPRKLADSYGVHYTTVIGYRNDLREGKVDKEILDVADTDAHVLRAVAEGIKAKAARVLPTKASKDFSAKVDDITAGVSSLNTLDTKFHSTITKLLSWADMQIHEDMKLSDWRAIATQVAQLHEAVYSKGTTVQVQQNNTTSNSFTTGMVN